MKNGVKEKVLEVTAVKIRWVGKSPSSGYERFWGDHWAPCTRAAVQGMLANKELVHFNP